MVEYVIFKKIENKKMKSILLFLSLITVINVTAQITKDSLHKKMIKEVCAEITKKDLSKLNKDNMQTELSMMMMPAFMNNMNEIETVYGGGIADKKVMSKLGQELGMKLAFECPAFMTFAIKMTQDKDMAKLMTGNDDKKVIEEDEESPKVIYTPPVVTSKSKVILETTAVSGKLLAINQGDITTISVKGADGKTEKLYWLEYFENAEAFQKNIPSLINKSVKFSYKAIDVYNAAKKEYKYIMVITGYITED